MCVGGQDREVWGVAAGQDIQRGPGMLDFSHVTQFPGLVLQCFHISTAHTCDYLSTVVKIQALFTQ